MRISQLHDPKVHPLPLGTAVAVFRTAPSGLLTLEGRGIIRGFTNIPNLYRIRFADERYERERLVFPVFQHDPKALDAAFACLFRHENLASPSHDEFYLPLRRY